MAGGMVGGAAASSFQESGWVCNHQHVVRIDEVETK